MSENPTTARCCGSCAWRQLDPYHTMPGFIRCEWAIRNLPAAVTHGMAVATMRVDDGGQCSTWKEEISNG
jgi:hypothetical protein